MECLWHFVSGGGVLFSLASSLGLELLPQKTLSLHFKCPMMELSHIMFDEIPPSTFTLSAVIILPIFCLFLIPWLCLSYSFAGWIGNLVWLASNGQN